MYKLIVAFALMSPLLCGLRPAVAADICFIGSVTPQTGAPGDPSLVTVSPTVQNESAVIKNAFDVTAPVYESSNLDDFSAKAGYVYVSEPLFDYLSLQIGTDPEENGAGLLLAHEYAHQFQFKIWSSGYDSMPKSLPQTELEADVVAGIWIGITNRHELAALRRQVGPSFDRQIGIDYVVDNNLKAADLTYSYLSWSPSLHGTSQQRQAAIKAGILYGEDFYQALPADAFKTYAYQIYDYSKQTAGRILAG